MEHRNNDLAILEMLRNLNRRLDKIEASAAIHDKTESERLDRIESRFSKYEGAAGMLILFTTALWAVFGTLKEFLTDRIFNG